MAVTAPMATIEVSLGRLLRHWRVQAGLSAEDVVERANALLAGEEEISRSTLYRYEQDRFPQGSPRVLLLSAIARACGHLPGELPGDLPARSEHVAAVVRNRCSSYAA